MKQSAFFLFFLVLICSSAKSQDKVTVQYKQESGVKKDANSLDIYPSKNQNRPVVVFVHGGAWLLGDKDNKIANKVEYFKQKDYVLVSVNYRLSSIFSKKIQYPDHPNDVADAVLWIKQIIQKYGGNPNNIVLMGHSAGAQIVSLLGTSEEFLPKRGINVNSIKGIISLDTEGYDVKGLGEAGVKIYKRIFGNNPEIWTKASPLYNIEHGKQYPPFLIACRGESYRCDMAHKFAEKLKNAGADAEVFSAEPYSHFEVNNKFGSAEDQIVTPKVAAFLDKILK